MTDEDLIEQYRAAPASQGGRSSLNQLFERYHARVAAWCYRITGNADTAAELAQEVFLKAYQRLDSFRGDSKFATWMYSIARNRCLDEFKLRATRPDETTAIPLELIHSKMEDVSLALERRETAERLRVLIRESLDETEAKVMKLHYVDELPLDAITRLLGLNNESGAKAYVVTARRKLQRTAQRKGWALGPKEGDHGK